MKQVRALRHAQEGVHATGGLLQVLAFCQPAQLEERLQARVVRVQGAVGREETVAETAFPWGDLGHLAQGQQSFRIELALEQDRGQHGQVEPSLVELPLGRERVHTFYEDFYLGGGGVEALEPEVFEPLSIPLFCVFPKLPGAGCGCGHQVTRIPV